MGGAWIGVWGAREGGDEGDGRSRASGLGERNRNPGELEPNKGKKREMGFSFCGTFFLGVVEGFFEAEILNGRGEGSFWGGT